jgi:hypothetical protein
MQSLTEELALSSDGLPPEHLRARVSGARRPGSQRQAVPSPGLEYRRRASSVV